VRIALFERVERDVVFFGQFADHVFRLHVSKETRLFRLLLWSGPALVCSFQITKELLLGLVECFFRINRRRGRPLNMLHVISYNCGYAIVVVDDEGLGFGSFLCAIAHSKAAALIHFFLLVIALSSFVISVR